MNARMTRYEHARGTADYAKSIGHKEAYDLALQALWDFDFAMCADKRGERSRAWAKRSSGNRALKKARELLKLSWANKPMEAM